MKKMILVSTFGILSLLMTSCQTVPYQGKAREVKRKPMEGGVIALDPNYRPEDRTKADERMKSNCANNSVKVLEEGEVSIGQTTSSNIKEDNRESTKRKVGKLWGMPITTGEEAGRNIASSSTVMDVKEWQISYECAKGKKISR